VFFREAGFGLKLTPTHPAQLGLLLLLPTGLGPTAANYTCPMGRAGPARPGHGLARHDGHQSKPGTVWYRAGPGRPAGWLTRPRPGTVILTRAVPGRRHGGPVVPGRARSYKHKKTLQNSEFKGIIQIYFRFS
jgi:hypothetical protein